MDPRDTADEACDLEAQEDARRERAELDQESDESFYGVASLFKGSHLR